MFRGARSKGIAIVLLAAFVLFMSPYWLDAANEGRGNLIGFVFNEDGATPKLDAIVTAKNVTTGKIFISENTDQDGVFRIPSMDWGVYVLGVSTEDGDFNSSNLVGIRSNKTTKLSIALSEFDSKMQQATQQVYEEQKRDGESLVGKIESYDPASGMAMVYILKGYLQREDRIHALGMKDVSDTDFFQNVKIMTLDGRPAKRVFAGQTIMIKLEKPGRRDDLIYLVCKDGILPIFLTPLGIAAIIAGTGIVYSIITFTDDTPEVTAFKK